MRRRSSVFELHLPLLFPNRLNIFVIPCVVFTEKRMWISSRVDVLDSGFVFDGARLERKEGIPAGQQHLCIRNREIELTNNLCNHILKECSLVEFVAFNLGGMEPQRAAARVL